MSVLTLYVSPLPYLDPSHCWTVNDDGRIRRVGPAAVHRPSTSLHRPTRGRHSTPSSHQEPALRLPSHDNSRSTDDQQSSAGRRTTHDEYGESSNDRVHPRVVVQGGERGVGGVGGGGGRPPKDRLPGGNLRGTSMIYHTTWV